jgi:hypothetical protein
MGVLPSGSYVCKRLKASDETKMNWSEKFVYPTTVGSALPDTSSTRPLTPRSGRKGVR